METEHEFILTVDGVTDLSREVVDALFEAGCDDATIMMQAGRISMGFTRSAPDMKAAVFSATADVQKAGIGARVVRVDPVSPNSVGAEMAREVGNLNSAFQLFNAIEIDPTLRPWVIDYLARVR